jgi:ligand-binding SRPBCC domain-containing protein
LLPSPKRGEDLIAMATIELITRIQAPPERCFDLSRSIDLHVASTSRSDERAVGPRTAGLLALGEEVTWSARHFGVRQRLTSRITAFDRPRHFRDSMVSGAFERFDHDHFFVARGAATEMRDVFDFESPLGPLGRIADALVLTRYLRGFLIERNEVIKQAAESDGWRALLPPD